MVPSIIIFCIFIQFHRLPDFLFLRSFPPSALSVHAPLPRCVNCWWCIAPYQSTVNAHFCDCPLPCFLIHTLFFSVFLSSFRESLLAFVFGVTIPWWANWELSLWWRHDSRSKTGGLRVEPPAGSFSTVFLSYSCAVLSPHFYLLWAGGFSSIVFGTGYY